MRSVDTLIAGTGPAGCVAGSLLARRGFDVLVIGAPRLPAVCEGVSERVVRALEQAGFGETLETLGQPVQREASWRGETIAANREWMVERARFDQALRQDARAAGAEVQTGVIRRVDRTAAGWGMTTSLSGLRGRFLVEARGRRAPGRRRYGPAAVALTQSWTGLEPRPRTAVAPFTEGWAWFATAGQCDGTVQVVVADTPNRQSLAEAMTERLAAIPEARDWLAGARSASSVVARHAGMSRAATPIDGASIRIGDAALALDPLSGHGVFEAIASATAAVHVIATLFGRPTDAALARAFYDERVDHAFLRFARVARDFYRQEQRWPERPFWRERRAWPDDLPSHTAPGATTPTIAIKPVVKDGFVVTTEVVVTADYPRGVYQVEGVPLVPLLRLLEQGGAERAATVFGGPEKAATAQAWLRYRGLI